jgi:GntR family transcriptional repressor for pyruvate dehydrogenase complex
LREGLKIGEIMPEIIDHSFQKAKKSRIFQDVVEQIQEAILSRRLVEGDRLPPERELCETFNISRGTLREALRVLEHKGLLEIKLGTGGGAVIKSAGIKQLTETLALLIRFGKVSVIDIGEFRVGIESQIARLAAEKASKKDIVDLEKLIGQLKKYNDIGISAWENFLEIDKKLHMEIARISDNALYKYVVDVVHNNINKYFDRYLEVTDKSIGNIYKDLEQLIGAIKNKDKNLAAKLAKRHVNTFIKVMRKKEAIIAEQQQQ